MVVLPNIRYNLNIIYNYIYILLEIVIMTWASRS